MRILLTILRHLINRAYLKTDKTTALFSTDRFVGFRICPGINRFDEAHIDILTLKSCISAFDKFRPGKTGLVVSHNMQVINTLCKNVLVFQEEQPPCFGTHAELIESNDFYRHLVSEYQDFNSV